jgi:sugar transferase (PEP-CTERM/EpsH1 system associated)
VNPVDEGARQASNPARSRGDRDDGRRRRPVVCHIILRLDVGGLETGLVNLINHLPAGAYRHAIICLTEATDFMRQRIHSPDIAVFEVHKRRGNDLAAYGRVWRLLRALRPDIVHTRNLPALDMLAPAVLAGVRRLVHSEHGLDMVELDGRNRHYNHLRWLSRLVVRRYVAVSRDIAVWLGAEVGIPSGMISVIYNGVDAEIFRPAAAASALLPPALASCGAFVIGTVGRLEPVKDQLTLAEAFCRLLAVRPDLRNRARLVIIGDGTLRAAIEGVLASAGARALAWLPGLRSDAAELYRTFSVFVLPSRREGISNTLMEAMASGLPVVATRVGGNPEVVDEGRTGWLVPPADPEALAAALARYVDDPGLVTSHGHAARTRIVRDFSLAAMVRGYQQVYDSI